jgi:hypothetical protein
LTSSAGNVSGLEQLELRDLAEDAERGLEIGILEAAGGSAWVLLGGDRRVARIDIATRKVTARVTLPWGPGGRIASGAGSAWITEDQGARVARIEARTGKIADRSSLG